MKFNTIPQVDGGDFIRLMANAATFAVSVGNGETENVDLKGAIIALDLKNCRQGWLKIDSAGANWSDLETPDVWEHRPSGEHKPAVSLSFFTEKAPDPWTRTFRTNSQAGLTFVKQAFGLLSIEDTNTLPEAVIPTFRVERLTRRKAGSQTTTDITLKLAPADKWIPRKTLEEHRAESESRETESGGDSENW